MTSSTPPDRSVIHARRALSASGVFYVLVALEFLYMASPFATYFYAVYGPGLDWLELSGSTSWLIQFFMPHVVAETTSPLIDSSHSVGSVLLLGGLAGFAIGVFQIYRAKLTRRDAVTGGLYRHVRHPQYLALIVASIGMLLLWPRYLVLIMTVTVIFIYAALAVAEERMCLRRFPGYAAYVERTGRFLPAWFGRRFTLPPGDGRLTRLVGWGLTYVSVTAIALLIASGIRSHTIDSLYVLEVPEGVYLSVVELSDDELSAAAEIARSSPEVEAAVSGRIHLVNYVVPTEMYISEIPMELPPGETFGHTVPRNRDPYLYKIVFTQAVVAGEEPPPGENILRSAVNKEPLVEVHLDLKAREVVSTFPPPAKPFYGGVQVPVF